MFQNFPPLDLLEIVKMIGGILNKNYKHCSTSCFWFILYIKKKTNFTTKNSFTFTPTFTYLFVNYIICLLNWLNILFVQYLLLSMYGNYIHWSCVNNFKITGFFQNFALNQYLILVVFLKFIRFLNILRCFCL